MVDIAANLKRVQRRIWEAAERAGRDPSEIALVAVSKLQDAEAILAAYDLGVRHFGENRVEEASDKIPGVNSKLAQRGGIPPTWHMVGHLQSRKAKRAVELFDIIESVDSLRLAQEINKRCERKVMHVMLEVNVSGEASKYGFHIGKEGEREEFFEAVEGILALPHLKVQGLMTMAPIVSDPEETRPIFRRLRELRDELRGRFPESDWPHLSMGMTDDYEVAVEEGATMVRIGRAIFESL